MQMFVCVSTSICVSYAFSLVLLSFLFGCFVPFWFVLIFLSYYFLNISICFLMRANRKRIYLVMVLIATI